jgi:hypothetical protein
MKRREFITLLGGAADVGRCGACQVRCGCGCREGVGAELELASAVVMEYAPLPKFVPTHVTNFGSTTSRSVARRTHARA